MEALVKNSVVRLLKEMSFQSAVEDEVLCGMKVEILEQAGEWYRVRTHYRYEGFVNASELETSGEYLKNWDAAVHSRITKGWADILNQPKYQGSRIHALPRGAQVIVIGMPEESDWVKVMLPDGREGYVRKSFLMPAPEALYYDPCPKATAEEIRSYITKKLKLTEDGFRKRVTDTAREYLGTQYRWGGKSPLGIDCSGLCSIAYMLNGLVIYRDASIREGFPVHEIRFEEKKPGDLLYFPGHIAMYLGDGHYIHSTGKGGSDGVVINSLNPEDSDYREDLVRILKATGSVF